MTARQPFERRTPTPEVLRSMRELEVLLLQRRVDRLKTALDADQSDINVAFEADGLSWPDQPVKGIDP